MLGPLLFYGYAKRVLSQAVNWERRRIDSMAFMFFAVNEYPDYDTINVFHQRFDKEIEGLFVEILVLAEAMGFLKLGTVSLDGTKTKQSAQSYPFGKSRWCNFTDH